MKISRQTKAYKLVPTRLLSNIDALAKYAFGETVTKRIELYKKYLSISDKQYLDWAIENMVCWNQERPLQDVIHIHGYNDAVFPIKNIYIHKGNHEFLIQHFYSRYFACDDFAKYTVHQNFSR